MYEWSCSSFAARLLQSRLMMPDWCVCEQSHVPLSDWALMETDDDGPARETRANFRVDPVSGTLGVWLLANNQAAYVNAGFSWVALSFPGRDESTEI